MNQYKSLQEEAYEANLEIKRQNLAIYTWGNVSAFDPARSVFAIKPSGVAYDELKPESMVLVDLDGNIVSGSLKPSSDTKTHQVLYREFPGIRGITHTHSPYAVLGPGAKASSGFWNHSRRSRDRGNSMHRSYGPRGCEK